MRGNISNMVNRCSQAHQSESTDAAPFSVPILKGGERSYNSFSSVSR